MVLFTKFQKKIGLFTKFQKKIGLFTNLTKERQFAQAGKLILSAELEIPQNLINIIIQQIIFKQQIQIQYKYKYKYMITQQIQTANPIG